MQQIKNLLTVSLTVFSQTFLNTVRDLVKRYWSASEGVSEAMRLVAEHASTVVLADTQDNPGGGGSGDTTGLLQQMIKHNTKNAVFGALSDPQTVKAAIATGVGRRLRVELGGKSGLPGQTPFLCDCEVKGIFDGNFVATGPMYKGANMTLGLAP